LHPDIAVEIDITKDSRSKFYIYAALKIPEIWRYDGKNVQWISHRPLSLKSNPSTFPHFPDVTRHPSNSHHRGLMSKNLRLRVPKEARGKKLEQEYLSTAEAFVHEYTVLRLYRAGKVSTGTAGKVLGKPDFMVCRGARYFGGSRTTQIKNLRPNCAPADRRCNPPSGKEEKEHERRGRLHSTDQSLFD